MSIMFAFDSAAAKDRHNTQYFEIMGNRGIYHDGWLAGTVHQRRGNLQPRIRYAEDVWELYDVRATSALRTIWRPPIPRS